MILSVNRAGGRITSFKLNGFEFLTDKAINDFNYGSTFLSSPQAALNWPPLSALDNEQYKFESNKKVVKFISRVDSITGFQFVKEFFLWQAK